MRRYVPIAFSALCFFMSFLPCLGFAASITETKAAIGQNCVASGNHSTAMGYSTEASGQNSTAMGNGTEASGVSSTAMGVYTTASGNYSTATGFFTITGGDYSFGGGRLMKLTDTADHTFVWGHSQSNAETITMANAFLIFPAGTPGRVGIGTKNPEEKVHISSLSDSLGAAILLDSTGSANGRKFYVGSTLSGNVGGAGLFQIYDVTASKARFNIKASGEVGIGTTNPSYSLEVNGSAGKPGGGSWSSSSDERIKDITGAYDGGLDEILELSPVKFYYKEMNPRGLPTGKEYVGFIAQEVQDVFPDAVSEGPDGYLDFNMHPVNVALVNAVKELKAENEALKQEIRQIKTALGL